MSTFVVDTNVAIAANGRGTYVDLQRRSVRVAGLRSASWSSLPSVRTAPRAAASAGLRLGGSDGWVRQAVVATGCRSRLALCAQ